MIKLKIKYYYQCKLVSIGFDKNRNANFKVIYLRQNRTHDSQDSLPCSFSEPTINIKKVLVKSK